MCQQSMLEVLWSGGSGPYIGRCGARQSGHACGTFPEDEELARTALSRRSLLPRDDARFAKGDEWVVFLVVRRWLCKSSDRISGRDGKTWC